MIPTSSDAVLDPEGLKGILQEDYLKESSLLNLLPIAVYVCDARGIIRNYNEQAATLWGRRPHLGDHDERFCGAWRLYHPDGTPLPHDETPVAACLKDGLPRKNMEVVIERPDHSRIFVCVNIVPILDKEGNVIGMVNCFHDITDKKKAEAGLYRKQEELKSYAQRYRGLVQGLPAAVYTTDPEGRITMYNEAAVQLWGREPKIGEELYCGSWKIFDTDGAPLPLENCPMAVSLRERRPVFDNEIRIQRPDGTIRHVLPYPHPLYDHRGEFMGGVNMLVDLTERNQVEQALRENDSKLREMTITLEKKVEERTRALQLKVEELRQSEERYHRMIEEVEDYAIVLLDKTGIIQNWNRGAERIKGYREEEVVGKHLSIFYIPEDRQNGLPDQLIQRAINHGKSVHEGWRVRKNGTRFWASVVLTALHDAQSNIVGLTKVTRDLTERKLAEEKIKQYNADLEFQNRELEQFAYAAAHDMKEPLRKIRFYGNMIADSAGHQLPAREREYLNRCNSAASRMQELIDDLLAYSKISPHAYEFAPVDLNQTLQEVLQAHQETIAESNAVIKAESLPVIPGIAFQIRQLLDNLVSNALKYRHPDRRPHIRISVETISGTELPGTHSVAPTQFYKIAVADNGIGFDTNHTHKIFDLFYRLHDKTSYSGTGIGLAICRKVVQNHKGYITATGMPDKGAVFTACFPVRHD